jgi:hypothetical protein
MQMISKPSRYQIDVPGKEILPARTGRRSQSRRKGRALRIGDFCFLFAALAALVGMVAGIKMGISQDFTLAPAHAHLNLLGWVTVALYGLYHRSIGRVGGWVGWVQVLCGALGSAAMGGGLALYLGTGDDGYFPFVVLGSLLALLGMVLFLVIVLADLLGFSRVAGADKAAVA